MYVHSGECNVAHSGECNVAQVCLRAAECGAMWNSLPCASSIALSCIVERYGT